MIQLVSQTLSNVLSQPDLPSALRDAQKSFEAPTETFSPATPTLNIFLFDLKEDHELRHNEPRVVGFDGRARIEPPPFLIRCSYVVTAWAGAQTGSTGALLEHELLGQALAAFARHPRVPGALLTAGFGPQDPPLPMMTAQPDGPAQPAEFWSALGTPLRPAITVSVTAALPVQAPAEAALARAWRLVVRQREGGEPESAWRVDGRVARAGTGEALEGARLEAARPGEPPFLEARSGADGGYSLAPLPEAELELRVTAVGLPTRTLGIRVPDNLPPLVIELGGP